MFNQLLSNRIWYEIVKEVVSIAGIMPVAIDSVALNRFSSIAPELFLILCVTVIWCYLSVGWAPELGVVALRYVFVIMLLLYIYSVWQGNVAEIGFISNDFVLYSKILVVMFALPVLWLENLSITLALYFSAIILFNVGLIGSVDMLTTYVCLEGLSLVSYGIIATNKTRGSAEAGLKYFLYGIIASALLVFGLSLLYLQSQELSWEGIYLFLVFNAVGNQIELQVLSLLLILAALIYKLSLFPFHFTLPDVYEGTNWHTIAIINLGVKVGIALFLFRFWGLFIANNWISISLSIVLSWFAIMSLIIGCFGALIQTSLKRFFAYTSINQSGFIIMGLLTNSIFGLEASILYVIVYMLSNILFFYAVGNTASDDLAEVNNLKGIKRLGLGIALFSMAGIPPLFGFGSKYIVWLSLFDSVSSSLLTEQHSSAIQYLLIVSVIMSLISAFYYLRLIKITAFQDSLMVNISQSGTFIPVCVIGGLILWPLFIGFLLHGLENYSLLNYGSWITWL